MAVARTSSSLNGIMRVWDLEGLWTDLNGGVAEDESREGLPPAMQYANAKVLLVGDTGVGKSGLAERLVNKRFQPTKSTHARRASVLENRVVTEQGGVEVAREILLWDLAGQPAFRLVHQLSMEDAAVACVLFDSRSETNPFEGAAFWSKVLDQARTNTKLKKLLVASRIDAGGLPASKDRIEEFRRENGFDQFIPTSATTGEGCDELAAAIRHGVAWRDMPRITTSTSLAALREYVSLLKGKHDSNPDGESACAIMRLLTIGEVHEGFSAWFGEKTPLEAFTTHLELLEATDELDLLIFRSSDAKPRADHRVLLDPTRVDSYASALLVAAKDEPDGPGHLLESRVREGSFKLDPEERIPDRESVRHVLWHVIESLISRDLAIRESIKGKDYLVFPSQCTAELRFPGKMVFGVALEFSGAIRSIYATLVAQLAHYEGFKKREFFSDAALYSAADGGRCLIRLVDRGRGEGELEVSFETETQANIRQGFLEFIRKHVEARSLPGSLKERHAFYCANPDCRQQFDDRVVRALLQSRKRSLLCPYCWKKTPLLDLLASPTAAAASVAERMDTDARAGRQRMTAELVIAAKEAEGIFDVFLSHNSKDKAYVEKIARQLKKKGIRPWFDKWDLAPGDTVRKALERAVKSVPCAALFFGPADVGRWHIIEIDAYLEAWAREEARLIPVILPGVVDNPELPLFVRQTLWVDMRDWENEESDAFYRLVCGILGKPPGDSPMKRFGVRDVAQWQQKGRRTIR
jgi:small GTP-binding protein